MIDYIIDYHKSVCEAYRNGNIETSFNKPIMVLLEHFGCQARDLSGERSRAAGENIDIKLWQSDVDVTEIEPFAGVEVKKVGGIDTRAKSQIKTEAARYGYMILTDNLRWEFWRGGQDKMDAYVRLMDLVDGQIMLNKDKIESFTTYIQDFLLQNPSNIRSSNKLAEYMAIHARTIRTLVGDILKEDAEGLPIVDDRQRKFPMFDGLFGLYRQIKQDLRPFLTTRSFADMYAQTIVYGLFIARHNAASPENFNRLEAIDRLREESPLLSQFFNHIATSRSSHPTLDQTIDKLCNLYKICDISALLDDHERGDTIVHFYEDFLTYYDPALRKSLGVFYTPHQVVKYMVGMVDKLLVEEFGIEGGLSNNDHFEIEVESEEYIERKKTKNTKKISVPKVAILDPACGTGTFAAEIIKFVKGKYFSGGHAAFYPDYINDPNGLLSRMIGFEIMMTSYVVAHLNIRRTVEETLVGGGVNGPAPTIMPRVYLTNTLAPPKTALEQNEQISLFDFSAAIAEEAYNADTWKARRPIKVIIGNPPYLAASTTPFDVEGYKFEADGMTKLQERNAKLLGDDYVKFFRFAEQIISKNGEGILAFVSNNGYLSNPTFRGMRGSLLRTFDKVYIVDLHGSSVKKEIAPDGGRDENIFDIMQGVSLFIGIKTTREAEWAKVCHTNIWGLREQKFQELQEGNLDYFVVEPDPKMAYLFPLGNGDRKLYESGVSVADLFTVNASGVKTSNDEISIAPTKEELNKRLDIVRHAIDEEAIGRFWGKFVAGQSATKIQNDVLSPDGIITSIAYRPFDERWTYYSGKSGGWIDRPREKRTMGHLINGLSSPVGKNFGLVYTRGDSSQNEFSMVFVSKSITDNRITAAQTAGHAYVAPLYQFDEIGGWVSNLDPKTLARLTQYMTIKPHPIEIFNYIYAILHDPTYRKRFNDFLKRDFPRVPIINAPRENDDDFIVTEEMFHRYTKAGERLRKLHLMQEKVPATLTLDPENPATLEIATPKYTDGILTLNKGFNIHGIPEDVWTYRIGGYQVLDKWFKSHKGKMMTREDFVHIQNVVGLLGETIGIQEELGKMHI